jgi:hypothetical protein
MWTKEIDTINYTIIWKNSTLEINVEGKAWKPALGVGGRGFVRAKETG